ncbi:hypothetical protein BJ878DRAFT_475667 [Calycina marina]|uniref:Uncharacterized protein n=1 Tax=Calycina marina TaxID=1763456 RepID=A0A9P7ZCY4_9HELO|nr:hypothetical protein BJ878DRAFT_475667 [Calycina marina]
MKVKRLVWVHPATPWQTIRLPFQSEECLCADSSAKHPTVAEHPENGFIFGLGVAEGTICFFPSPQRRGIIDTCREFPGSRGHNVSRDQMRKDARRYLISRELPFHFMLILGCEEFTDIVKMRPTDVLPYCISAQRNKSKAEKKFDRDLAAKAAQLLHMGDTWDILKIIKTGKVVGKEHQVNLEFFPNYNLGPVEHPGYQCLLIGGYCTKGKLIAWVDHKKYGGNSANILNYRRYELNVEGTDWLSEERFCVTCDRDVMVIFLFYGNWRDTQILREPGYRLACRLDNPLDEERDHYKYKKRDIISFDPKKRTSYSRHGTSMIFDENRCFSSREKTDTTQNK